MIHTLDAENVTLRWPRPEGRVDVYHIKWYPNKNKDDIRQKEISGNVPTEGMAILVVKFSKEEYKIRKILG